MKLHLFSFVFGLLLLLSFIRNDTKLKYLFTFLESKEMAYRMGGGGNNRRTDNRFDRGGFGGGMNRPNPWGGDNMGGNFRQGGGNNGGMNNDVLSLANSLVNNLLRNQNHPPSLLDLPNRGGYGGGRDGRFNDRMGGVSVFWFYYFIFFVLFFC